ncbi:MAG: ATP-binding cassette domain-containing protein [Bacteroidales bacterium]|nr:ATP-binding cassette domain-containing protein [Bacteroidales bacterium]MBR6918838.1 ATP-binding cassette domain-containing protein [Bacteroidales bacterium]
MEVLEVRHVSKRFATLTALDDVSMAVGEHRIVGLLGPNGAGKTTLIRIINQITAPDEGEVLFRGERLSQRHIAQIGYLPEERGLYRKMKVGEQLVYLAQLKGVPKRDAGQRARHWLDKFEIGSWWNRPVEELSKGMQQKLQFISTVIHEPPFFIFDEPFSGFDPINAGLLKEEMLRLRENGASIIFSTHNMASVEELCDDIVLINRSKKILEGTVQEVRRRFRQHLFEVEYRPGGSPVDWNSLKPELFTTVQVSESPERCAVQLRLDPEATPNQLLSVLLPVVQVVSFRELLPSVSDIFIAQVKQMQKGGGDE